MKRLPYTRAGADTALTVALYARVSTNRGEQDPDNQLIQFRQYCQKRGWTIGAEYVDYVSGKTSDRQQFQQLFADAAKRRFDLVLFWSLDRFSREGTYPTLMLLQRLDSYGVGWKSLTEEYLDSCGVFKDVVIAMLSTLAKQERLRISERVRAGIMRVRAQRPTHAWGRRPIEIREFIPSKRFSCVCGFAVNDEDRTICPACGRAGQTMPLSQRQAAKLLGVSKTTIRRRRAL